MAKRVSAIKTVETLPPFQNMYHFGLQLYKILYAVCSLLIINLSDLKALSCKNNKIFEVSLTGLFSMLNFQP